MQCQDVGSVYMFPQKEKQLELWNHLLTLQPSNNQPWMIMGDFLNIAGLICLPYTGSRFTWCKTRIYERLDRVVANSACFFMFPHFSLNNLPIHDSDHGPIYLSRLNPRIPAKEKT